MRKRIILLLALVIPASAQTLVTVAGSDFRDAAGHKLSGTCSPNPLGVTAPPWFPLPVPTPFTVTNGAYSIALLSGNYSVTCSIAYGKQSVSIAMNLLIPGTGGPYRIDQVVVTSPTGQQYTVLAQQLASGGTDGQFLVKDSTAPTGQRWATIAVSGGSGASWNGSTVTWNGTAVTW